MYETDCEEVLRDLEAFLDGEIPRERAVVVEAHLSSCSPCFAHGEFRRRVQLIIRRKCTTTVELPAHLPDRVRQAIRSERA